MRCGILVQARMSSVRLPGKMLMELGGMPLVLWMLRRCALSTVADITALVTSHHPSDDVLAHTVMQAGFACFRGSLENVRQRYIQAGQYYQLPVIARVCGDSPFVDVAMLDSLLHAANEGKAHYLRVVDTVPGLVSEVFTLHALKESQNIEPRAMEHVTTTLRQHPQRFPSLHLSGISPPEGFPPLTIDTAHDITEVRRFVAQGCTHATASKDVLKLFLGERHLTKAI